MAVTYWRVIVIYSTLELVLAERTQSKFYWLLKHLSCEMIVIRPEDKDIALPAGRYALVLKDVGYDFTIDGSDLDAAHCLERTDALNAPIYTECRTPGFAG
jgi:hypothetical protein